VRINTKRIKASKYAYVFTILLVINEIATKMNAAPVRYTHHMPPGKEEGI